MIKILENKIIRNIELAKNQKMRRVKINMCIKCLIEIILCYLRLIYLIEIKEQEKPTYLQHLNSFQLHII